MAKRQIIIYCDESADKGKYFSHFYGGALIEGIDREHIEQALIFKKIQLNVKGELKWTKITENYKDKYIEFIDSIFEFIANGKIKIRIMYTQNIYEPTLLSDYHIENEYFLLYYQLIKHAFGLGHCNDRGDSINMHLLLDDMPDTPEKVKIFKNYLCGLSNLSLFKKAAIEIVPEDIAEVKSHNHAILQGLDIILGAMQFRLNDRHKEKPDGQRVRGKRTRAKEAVYKHINMRIRELRPGFNIGVTTPAFDWPKDLWNQGYRHWNFKPNKHRLDLKRSKKAP